MKEFYSAYIEKEIAQKLSKGYRLNSMAAQYLEKHMVEARYWARKFYHAYLTERGLHLANLEETVYRLLREKHSGWDYHHKKVVEERDEARQYAAGYLHSWQEAERCIDELLIELDEARHCASAWKQVAKRYRSDNRKLHGYNTDLAVEISSYMDKVAKFEATFREYEERDRSRAVRPSTIDCDADYNELVKRYTELPKEICDQYENENELLRDYRNIPGVDLIRLLESYRSQKERDRAREMRP